MSTLLDSIDNLLKYLTDYQFNGNNTNDKNVNVQTTLKANNKYDEINPDPSTIETTAMLSQRLNECVSTVHHNTKWAKVLDISSDWKFDSSLKKQIENLDNADAFTIPILSPIECNKLIELTELYGYEDCGYPKNYRSNTRMITNDPFLAARLYQRIKKCLPTKYHDKQVWTICGLNERFRWCKYVKGQKFGTHCDARFHRSLHEKSFYTVNIYLNDGVTDFKGGRTKFFVYNKSNGDLEMRNAVVASPGLAVIFNQHPEAIEHNGEELYDGVKYLMRTDVMYKMIENEMEHENEIKDNNKHILSLNMFLSIKNGHDEIIEKIKILSMAYKLDKTEQIKMIVYCLLKFEENDTKTLIESIKKYSNVLKTIISVDYAKIFLAFIEELIMIRNKGDGLWNKSYKIFECLYDEEILDEDEINEWYSNVDNVSRIIDDEQAKLIRQKTLPFIQWLQEADDGNND